MRRTHQGDTDEARKINFGNVLAIALTLTLHIVGFGMLMLPARFEPPAEVERVITVRFLEPVVIPPPPPPPPPPPEEPKPVVTKPVTKTPPKPAPPKPRPATTPAPTAVVATEVEVATTPNVVQGPPADPGPPTPDPAPSNAEPTINDAVVVVSGPRPKYPIEALRSQIQGEVVLIVDIDGAGKPTAVRIERSSGDRSLDREARSTVLRSWRFQATGSAQRARLPIRFALD